MFEQDESSVDLCYVFLDVFDVSAAISSNFNFFPLFLMDKWTLPFLCGVKGGLNLLLGWILRISVVFFFLFISVF